MNTRRTLLAGLWLTLVVGSLTAADWPGFRGSNGGVADDKNIPAEWSKDNILWKVKLPGLGTSSPITVGDKIFLTAYSGYGTKLSKGMKGGKGGGGGGKGGPDTGGDQKDLRLHLICLDRAAGKIVWKKEIEPKLPEASFSGFLREHGYASSTPVSDGEFVYVFFGKTGVFAFDLEGNKKWQADVGSSTDKWGSASSPVVHKDVVIVNAAVESRSLVGLDRKTGKELWRNKGIRTNWVSPILVPTKDDKVELVLSLPGKIAGYDPLTGKELWHCQGIGSAEGYGYTCSTPVARDGVVYIIGGGGPTTAAAAIAVKTGGSGDVDKTHVVWRAKTGSSTCSPVLSGDTLCWVAGNVTCLKISDGSTAYNERLYGGRGEYVSAVAAGDKIFALTRFEGLFVLQGGEKFQKLSQFSFDGDDSIFNASPAISDGRVYIRSNEYLYCIGKK